MIARIAAFILAGTFVGFAILMTSAVLWPPAPATPAQASAQPDAELSIQTDLGALDAEVLVEPGMIYRLDLHVAWIDGVVGPIRPTVILEMADMAMSQTRPSLRVLSTGEFHAEGRFAMPGRWLFRIGFGDELHVLAVNVPPDAGG